MRVKFLNLEWAGTNSTCAAAEGFPLQYPPPKKKRRRRSKEKRGSGSEYTVGWLYGFYRLICGILIGLFIYFFYGNLTCVASYAGAPSLRFKALEFPNSAFSAKEKEDGEKKKNYWISEKNMETRRRRSGLKWLKPKFRASEYGGNPPSSPPNCLVCYSVGDVSVFK